MGIILKNYIIIWFAVSQPMSQCLKNSAIRTSLIASLLMLVASSQTLSQEVTPANHSYILQLLDSSYVFVHWKTKWKEHLPSMTLEQFTLYRESEIEINTHSKKSPLEYFLSKPNLAFFSFSPNGLLAVSSSESWSIFKRDGFYHVGYDDSSVLRLYDFSKEESYVVVHSGLYGPGFHGFAWLNDNLLVAVGAIWDLAKERDDYDQVAPAAFVFDFAKMWVSMYRGNNVPAKDYYKNRPRGLSFETKLMFDYRPDSE
ncbi:MAG: hypothetical protein IH852_03120 [Bacteroidetes bacterium]|nr:hypothetical protein [Bacteroidota bacterium]